MEGRRTATGVPFLHKERFVLIGGQSSHPSCGDTHADFHAHLFTGDAVNVSSAVSEDRANEF